MKKLLLGFVVSASLFACTETAKKTESTEQTATAAVEHIYKPTYTDNFKIGDQKNVLIAEQIHQAMFAKDFNKVGEFLADTAVFWMEDGSTIKGKAGFIEFLEKNFSQLNIKDYKVSVSIPVVGENGHEWVLMWDEANVETPDGKTQRNLWMDGFRFENGKVVLMNGYVKAPK
jgi:predicted SnoaL-like aldol condensation-catalyzing enzyme